MPSCEGMGWAHGFAGSRSPPAKAFALGLQLEIAAGVSGEYGTKMDIAIRKPSELGAAERDAWREFVAADPALGSPYFAVEFAECCEEARNDTRVLVVRENGQITGFLPFQQGLVGYARPLGGPLSDVHGTIGEPGRESDPRAWLREAGIPVFEFHGALASQRGFHEGAAEFDGSWMIDVSNGYEGWEAQRRTVSSKPLRNIATRYKRLNEVEGGYNFVMADDRPDAFEKMIDWKREQYQTTGVFDVFSVPWTRKLLEAIMRRQCDHFSGVCSTLNIGGEIVAVHVGMMSDRVCQYWFPTFDRAYSTLSPGLLLLVETIRTAEALGQQGIELGPGEFGFKKDLSTYQVPLATGTFCTPSMLGHLHQIGAAMVKSAEAAPLGPASAWPGKAMRKIDRLAGFYAA